MRGIKRALIIIMLLCLAVPPTMAESTDGVTLVCLNVGKADCLLLLNGDRAYLIDTGYDYTYPALETMLKHYNVTRLDAVFLTHCHLDHEGGLMPLAKSDVEIGAWYASPFYIDVKPGQHPAMLAAEVRGDTVTFLTSGQTIDAGDGTSFTVIGPLSEDTENENNNSLVMRFDSPDGSILLTGDMKADEEAELLYEKLISTADILKVGHHGDSAATTKALLTAVAPKLALISTLTAEEPDTPARSTLMRLKEAGAQTYVTQDAENAVVATLKNGEATAEYVSFEELPVRAKGLTMTISVENDLLTLTNRTDEAIDLSGYTLVSIRGGEWFVIESGVVPARGVFTIGTKTTKISSDLTLPDKRVWHKSKLDTALLYDAYGRLIAVTDNGMPE